MVLRLSEVLALMMMLPSVPGVVVLEGVVAAERDLADMLVAALVAVVDVRLVVDGVVVRGRLLCRACPF